MIKKRFYCNFCKSRETFHYNKQFKRWVCVSCWHIKISQRRTIDKTRESRQNGNRQPTNIVYNNVNYGGQNEL